MASQKVIKKTNKANIANVHRCKYVEIAMWQFILHVAFHAAMSPVNYNQTSNNLTEHIFHKLLDCFFA